MNVIRIFALFFIQKKRSKVIKGHPLVI